MCSTPIYSLRFSNHALVFGILLILFANTLCATHVIGFKNNILPVDSIPKFQEDTMPKIIYWERIDTIITFDPDSYEETVKVVKSMVVDTLFHSDAKLQNDNRLKPAKKQQDEIKLFQIIEKLPRFPGCEHLGAGMEEVEECARLELLRFVNENLQYPENVKKNGVDVKLLVRFTVRKDGSVSDINVVRDIGLDVHVDNSIIKAAIDVIEKMNTMDNRWIPGTQRGKAVDFKYTLPIYFKSDTN